MFKYSIHEVVIGDCVNQEPLDRVPQNLIHKLCETTKYRFRMRIWIFAYKTEYYTEKMPFIFD